MYSQAPSHDQVKNNDDEYDEWYLRNNEDEDDDYETKSNRKTAHPIPEKVNHQNHEEDGEWTKVERKHKGNRKVIYSTGRKDSFPRYGGRVKVLDFDKVMKEKAFSFFFTNFLDSWDSEALWKMFSRYGSVVDVYIAFKRTKKGTRFGFVRFINIGDPVSFERKLKTILIGDIPLVINIAKFFKSESVGFSKADFPAMKTSDNPKSRPTRHFDMMSFKAAVTGPKASPQVSRVKVSIVEDGYARSKLECCWTGKAKNIQDIALKSMKENSCWMSQWFTDVKPWEDIGELHGRLTWLVIEGLHVFGRNLDAIKRIASRFGKLLEVGRLNIDSNVLNPVKALILTYNMKDIGQSIDVVLNNRAYPVRLFEDVSFNSKFLRGINGNWHEKSLDLSSFEEEIVGPFMEMQDGEDYHTGVHGGDDLCHSVFGNDGGIIEKSSSFHSPRDCHMVLNNVVNEEGIHDSVDDGMVDYVGPQEKENMDFVRPTPFDSTSGPALFVNSMPVGTNIIPDLNDPLS
uniref:Nucleotide-binding alpha-beta plait domain-containing protein n=1 Tax=Tanacetum cinerariifolium TaxID=118510 RepID=A0A699GPK0_TANCI|nr:nucleotide-binding alpha-beta plait domain-containing protein [Tanacetum cinerariifolium]